VTHVAIVDARIARSLVDGRKRVESRFARHRRAPYGRVVPGDSIYFKVAGGEVIGRAPVKRVREFNQLTPKALTALRRRYNDGILAPATYWDARRQCRYGVLIWLGRFVRRTVQIALPRQYGTGWVILPGPGA
jgi:ASC-1-like (ASCH) protein